MDELNKTSLRAAENLTRILLAEATRRRYLPSFSAYITATGR